MLKEAGAAEVHVVITSPPMKNPCFYGIDTSTHEELIASSKIVEEIREMQLERIHLTFLSVEGMVEAIGRPFEDENGGLCHGMLYWKISNRNFPRHSLTT